MQELKHSPKARLISGVYVIKVQRVKSFIDHQSVLEIHMPIKLLASFSRPE